MIIAIFGEKGGTGKTTLATNLAGMRAAANRDVLIIDADRQGSASYWTEKRGLFAMFEARSKSFHSKPLCASAGCVHFADHTPSAESA